MYRLSYPYGAYITICCGLGALGAVVLAVRPAELWAVYTGVALVGMSFGGIWPISTTILRSMFPGARFGMALGVRQLRHCFGTVSRAFYQLYGNPTRAG